jgi:effector-binding domain-containing protein
MTKMKKITLLILAIAFIIVTCIYFLIPSPLKITNQITIEASDAIASKFLIQENEWGKWWPGSKTNDSLYTYNGVTFHIDKTTNSGVNLSFEKNGLKFNSEISYLADNGNSVKITWLAEGESSTNLIQKITDYLHTKALKDETTAILLHLKVFLEDEKNTYGYKIYLNKVKDPILLTTATTLTTYPDMVYVYENIKQLKDQAKAQGAKETNFPMLNVTQTDDKQYETRIALPIDKLINPLERSSINKLVRGGNLLVADVKGGPNTVHNAFSQVKLFMKDHGLISPAMPFESLVTDRSVEQDTAKWVTKIYYPIF